MNTGTKTESPTPPASEPVHFRAVLDPNHIGVAADRIPKVIGFENKSSAENWIEEQRTFKGWNYSLQALYLRPAPCYCKSQPAQPDPRDKIIQKQAEALRVARESIARIEQPLANIADVLSVNSAVKEANNGLRLLNKALAAIDALIGDN